MTVAASAALHDGYAYMGSWTTDFHFSKFFAAVFAAIVAWELAAEGRRWLAVRLRWVGSRWASGACTLVSRVCLAAGLVTAAVAWG